jgi:hypothetical protein
MNVGLFQMADGYDELHVVFIHMLVLKTLRPLFTAVGITAYSFDPIKLKLAPPPNLPLVVGVHCCEIELLADAVESKTIGLIPV